MKQAFPSLDEYLHTIATQEAENERLQAKYNRMNEYAHKIEEEARQAAFDHEKEVERLRAALIQIEAGYSHPQLSVAEMATIARQALNAAS